MGKESLQASLSKSRWILVFAPLALRRELYMELISFGTNHVEAYTLGRDKSVPKAFFDLLTEETLAPQPFSRFLQLEELARPVDESII